MTPNIVIAAPGPEVRGLCQAAGAMFLVGTLAAVSGVIGDYPVYGGQALRYLLGAAVLLAAARLMGLRLVRPTRREAVLLAALSLLGLIVFNVCVIEATRRGGPALVGTVLGTTPLALALLGGRPSPRVTGGAAVVVAGATLATGLGGGGVAGLLWSLGALVCEVSFSLLAVPLLPRLGAVRVSAYAAVLAVGPLAVTGLLVDGAGVVRVPTPPEALGLGYQAVVVTALAFFLWYDALPRLGPGTAGLFAGLVPVGAIATGTLLGVATPSAADLLGAALVVAGIVIGLSATVSRARATASGRPGPPAARGPQATRVTQATQATQATRSAAGACSPSASSPRPPAAGEPAR